MKEMMDRFEEVKTKVERTRETLSAAAERARNIDAKDHQKCDLRS